MKTIIIILFTMSLAQADESYWYARVSLGNNNHTFGGTLVVPWDNAGCDGIGGSIAAGWATRFNKKHNLWVDISWQHFSQIDCGAPFNNEDESSLDTYGISFEKRWR